MGRLITPQRLTTLRRLVGSTDGSALLHIAGHAVEAGETIPLFGFGAATPEGGLIAATRRIRRTSVFLDAMSQTPNLSPGLRSKLVGGFFDEDVINGRLAAGVPIEDIFPSMAVPDGPNARKILVTPQQIDGFTKPWLVEGQVGRARTPTRSYAEGQTQAAVVQKLKDNEVPALNDIGMTDGAYLIDELTEDFRGLSWTKRKAAYRMLNGVKKWQGSHLFARSEGFDWDETLNIVPAIQRANVSSMGNIEKYVKYLRDNHPGEHIHQVVEALGPWRRIEGDLDFEPMIPAGVRYRVYWINEAAGGAVRVKELPMPVNFFDPAEFIWMSEAAMVNFYKRMGNPMMHWRGH